MRDDKYDGMLQGVLKAFREKGDVLRCVNVFEVLIARCDLCSHEIRNVHVLMNKQTKGCLCVGANCIIRYKEALRRMGEDAPLIEFAPSCRGYGEKINKKCPGTVVVKDAEDGAYVYDPDDSRQPLRNIANEGTQDVLRQSREQGCDPEDLLYKVEYDEDFALE
jgi:hypothetical protein